MIQKKKIDYRRFFGNGGMPSTHSATVASLAVAIGFQAGWDSPPAAIAFVFAFIVMNDASTVRLAAGKHAKALNEIIQEVFSGGQFHNEKFEELLGHTRLQVLAGAILGVIVSIISYQLF